MGYQPKMRITPYLLQLLTQASTLKAWIDASTIEVPWVVKLQRETASRITHSSTAIEGNPLTLPEVEALARGEEIPAGQRDRLEILNHLAALRWIWQQKPGADVTESRLLQMHRLITTGLVPAGDCGVYKNRQNRVVDGRGMTVHLPPSPEQAAPLVCELIDWIASSETRILHPLIVSAIAHHRLVSIHPFVDGNGRSGRALAVWILWTRGFDTQHMFAVDEYYWQDRSRYYQKIQQVRELDDDLTYWLEYAAEALMDALQKTRKRVESLQISAKVPKLALTVRQENLLRFVRDHGRVRAPQIQAAFKISRARVGQLLRPLIDAGILLQEGQRRGTTYRLG